MKTIYITNYTFHQLQTYENTICSKQAVLNQKNKKINKKNCSSKKQCIFVA
jgi:hypothetical protein